MEHSLAIATPAFKRDYHHSTKFNEVARIVKIDSEQIELAPNIAFASGSTRAEKYQSALSLLIQNPSINAVIAFYPPRQEVATALSELYASASGKRFRLSCVGASITLPDGIKTRLQKYSDARKINLKKEYPALSFANDNLSATANLWESIVEDSLNLSAASIVDTTLTYVPEYTHQRGAENYINTHIDNVPDSHFDIRIVEVQQGSGTIIFDNNDFEINGSQLSKRGGLITGWELATGSSVVMRSPSERALRNGGQPCIHAHGIGQEGRSEQRLVSKCDLKID